MNFTVSEIIEATGGWRCCGDLNQNVERICTDTRVLGEGETFLALRGPNFNGDEFIEQALRKGAAGIITSSNGTPTELADDKFYIQVDDTLQALGDIAREWRRVVNPQVCALTGSSGKTTTKEMLAYICRGRFATHATEGNFNNRIGLPLTLFRLREEHELAIVELGMNQPGELAKLAEICLPDIAVITNIGNAHIGNFGSVENLIRAKAELFEAMPRDGTAIVNADCPHASIMAEAFKLPKMIISYGQEKRADVRAERVRLVEPYGYRFTLVVLDEFFPVHLKVFGRYQVSNALAAAAAAARIGVPPAVIAERLHEFDAPAMRAQTEWLDGVLVISDCYNASPDATITSLMSLNDIGGISQRFAVLGDMLELGDHAEKYHRNVGTAAAEAHIDFLCTIGEEAAYIREEAENRGIAAKHFDNTDDIAEFLHRKLKKDDALIIKGSRLCALEQVLLRLKEMRSEERGSSSRVQQMPEVIG